MTTRPFATEYDGLINVADTVGNGDVRPVAGGNVMVSNADPGASSSDAGLVSDKHAHDAFSSDQLLSSDHKLVHDAKSSDDAVSSQKFKDDASSSNASITTVWNQFDKTNITLSDFDHVATASSSGVGGVRATHGHSAGKYYFELTVDDAAASNQFNTYGMATAAQILNSSPYGGSANFAGLILGEYGGGGHFDMGQVVIRFAVDFDQNTQQWSTSLENGAFFFPPNHFGSRGVKWFPYCFIEFITDNTNVTLNTGDRPFAYPVPLGFEPWNQGTQGPDSASVSTFDSILVGSLTASGSTNHDLFIRSLDGSTWTLEQSPANSIGTSIAYQNFAYGPEVFRFVAVAPAVTQPSLAIATSTDGITWHEQTVPAANHWNDVCWSHKLRLFVAVGSSGSQRVMTSPDGLTWTLRNSADDTKTWASVCYSEELGLFCAVGTGGVIMTSPDGITWTSQTGATSQNWVRVRYCDDQFVTIISGHGMTSPDGITWTDHTSVTSTGFVTNFAWSTDLQKFITVANTGLGIVRRFSKDFSVNEAGTPPALSGGYSWGGAIWSDALKLFIICGSGDAAIMTSPDGLTWTSVETTSAFNAAEPSNANVSGAIMIYEGIIYHESLSSELQSQIDSLQRVSSDKGNQDGASSSKFLQDQASSSDAEIRREQASSSDALHEFLSDQHLSSNIHAKIDHDAASSSNLLQALHDLSDKHLRDEASSSDKPAHDAASSSDKPEKDAESSSDKLVHDAFSSDHHASIAAASDAALSDEIASEVASDLANTPAPPVQIVATICS